MQYSYFLIGMFLSKLGFCTFILMLVFVCFDIYSLCFEKKCLPYPKIKLCKFLVAFFELHIIGSGTVHDEIFFNLTKDIGF